MNMEDRKPKIIFWNADFSIGGSEKIFLTLIDNFKTTYQIIGIILPKPGKLDEEIRKRKLPFIFLPIGEYTRGRKNIKDIFKYVFYTVRFLGIGTKKIKAEKYTLLYVNGLKLIPFAFLIGKITKLPIIVHLHHVLEDTKSIKLVDFMGRSGIFKKFIAVSETIKNQFPSIGNKIEVIYNGVDTSFFSPQKGNKLHLRKKLGIEEEDIVIGLLARIIPHKGIHIGIEAMRHLKKESSLKIKLIIAGDTPLEEQGYKKRLMQMVKDEGLAKEMIFLPYQKDVNQIFNILNILIVPSTTIFEGCPMVILEAYAAGVPVVGSNLGGIPEFIKEGETGFIFKANTPKDLAAKILQIITDSQLYNKMKEQCRNVAIEKFDIKLTLKNIKLVLDKTLALHYEHFNA